MKKCNSQCILAENELKLNCQKTNVPVYKTNSNWFQTCELSDVMIINLQCINPFNDNSIL